MEVGFGRGVGRKGNGMMRERMKTEEKMRWNTMTLEFESRPCNESFARVSAAAFLAQLNPTVEEVADVKTAISEAVTNAMIHGYRQEKGKIQMKCVLDLEEKVFQVTVKDTGVGIEKCGEGDGADVYDLPGAGAVGDGVFVYGGVYG
mgnify:CR=1 FL=1